MAIRSLLTVSLLTTVSLLQANVGCAAKEQVAPQAATAATPKSGDAPAGSAEKSASGKNDGDPFAPRAPDAAWFVVGRDATAESAESALRGAGVDVTRESSARGGFTSLKGERDGWTIAVYFDAAGKMLINVVVTSTHGSHEIGDATEARLRKRFGVPNATVKAVEQAWRRREGEPKAQAPGGLEWGMTPPKAKAALDLIGFETKGSAAASAVMLTSTKTDRTIRLSFSDTEGLTEAVMRCEGDPRFDEVQKALGSPRSTTRSTVLRWSPAGSDVELYVDEKIPGAAWTVRETIAVKKKP